MPTAKPGLIFSVDVEDWPQSTWERKLPIGDYCADDTRRLLNLMADFDTARGTFFVLGKFAEKHPAVVREIHAAGHEVASHGYGHQELFRLGREGFAQDLARATAILSDLTGQRPRGYRAPDFSIVGESLWAFDVLAENGYVYDSSIFPWNAGRYGIPTWPIETVRVKLDNGLSILECPLTVTVFLGRRWPISGGGYARLPPRPILRHLLRAAAGRRKIPPVFYCHPYELNPDEFRRLPFRIPGRVRLHQGIGRRTFAAKLRMLLRRFECRSFAQVLAEARDVREVDYGPYKISAASVARPPIF